jgi:ribulose-phosphate 3-epimerase
VGDFFYSEVAHAIKPSYVTADPLPLIHAIHERKMKAGVAISPDTPSTAITDDIAAAADMLLVMTVYPGT